MILCPTSVILITLTILWIVMLVLINKTKHRALTVPIAMFGFVFVGLVGWLNIGFSCKIKDAQKALPAKVITNAETIIITDPKGNPIITIKDPESYNKLKDLNRKDITILQQGKVNMYNQTNWTELYSFSSFTNNPQ